MRNAINRSTVQYVRRDTGTPGLDETGIQAEALAAYNAHPEPIPYESPRYRAFADLNANGVIEGQAELLPLYVRAARDYNTPVFQYGSPRLWRLGLRDQLLGCHRAMPPSRQNFFACPCCWAGRR